MIKTSSSTQPPCGNPTTSNCVTWEGENIECLGIEKGQLLSVTVKLVADEVCELIETLDLSDLDLKCIFDFCAECPEPEKTLQTVLELIINKICSLQDIINNLNLSTGSGSDPILTLASCFQFVNAEGDLVTELPHTTYTKRIANQVCQILLDMASLQEDVLTLQNTVIDLQTQINALNLNIPDVSSDCLFVGIKSIEDAWDLLDQAFCQFRTAVGMPTQINLAISRQCEDLDAEFGSTPGWTINPTTLAQTIGNMWIVVCANKATIDVCCVVSCEDVLVGFSASLNEDNSEMTLKFNFGSGTSIPVGWTDQGSTGTITDIDGNVESFSLIIENNAEIVVPISGLNVNGNLVVNITALIGDGATLCQKCIIKTVKSTVCSFCEICTEGEEGSSMVVVYESDSNKTATLYEPTTTTTTTSTTTTTTIAP